MSLKYEPMKALWQISLEVETQDVETSKASSGPRCNICPIAKSLHRKLQDLAIQHENLTVTAERASFISEGTLWSCLLPTIAKLFIRKFDNPNMYDEPTVPQTFFLTFEGGKR
jgi:hypothetical protein